jgi:polysaccharide pyruvyl transferase WcaK-like protein
MKVVILNYTGYRSNWGSQATSRGLMQWIVNDLFKDRPSSIEIVPYPPSHWRDHWQQKMDGEFLKELYANPKPKHSELIRLERLCSARFTHQLERVKNADIVFFQGEGAIVGSRIFRRTQLFGLPFLAKHLYRKPIISCNQTISFSNQYEETILKNVFSSFDLNFVREAESLRICAGPGWPEFEFMPDAAFFYHGTMGSKFIKQSGTYFCVTGSADLNSYDLEAYARTINGIRLAYNLEPVFIYSRKSDKAVAEEYEKFAQRHATVISHKSHADVDDLVSVLSGAVCVLGGRYHTSITGLSLNVPAILTNSNSHKSIGLAKIFHDEAKLVDYADQNTIIKHVAKILTNPARLKSRLNEKVNSLQRPLHVATNRTRLFLELDKKTPKSLGKTTLPVNSLNNMYRNLWLLKALIRVINLGAYDRPALIEKPEVGVQHGSLENQNYQPPA